MLDLRPLWTIAAAFPRAFRGASLHRAALGALHRGEWRLALRLFDAGGRAYRRELAVEPLARLRVHELIARVRSRPHPEREIDLCLEVERRLGLLGEIEALEPPFERVPARALLATWLVGVASSAPRGVEAGETVHAA